MTIQTTPRTRPQSRRKRMVRKQIYILPKQDEGLKRLAEQRGASEAELIREAIETLLQAVPVQEKTKPLPPNQAAWQSILESIQNLKPDPERTEPYRWNREELYEERMAKILKHHGDEPL